MSWRWLLLPTALAFVAGCPTHRHASVAKAPAADLRPSDVEDALRALDRVLSSEAKDELRTMSEGDLVMTHFGLGMWIRNNFGLWAGSDLAKWFRKRGVRRPDSMSGILIEAYWRHLNGQPLRLEESLQAAERDEKRGAQEAAEWDRQNERYEERIERSRVDLRLERMDTAPTVDIPAAGRSLWLSDPTSFRGGFIVPSFRGHEESAITIRHYFFDPTNDRLSEIRIRGIDSVESIAVEGDTLWASGLEDGARRVVRISDDYEEFDPPPGGRAALVIAGDDLLALTSAGLSKLVDSKWTTLRTIERPLRSPTVIRQRGGSVFVLEETPTMRSCSLWEIPLDPTLPAWELFSKLDLPGNYSKEVVSFDFDSAGGLWVTADVLMKGALFRGANPDQLEVLLHENFRGSKANAPNLGPGALYPSGQNMILAAQSGLYRCDGRSLELLIRFLGDVKPRFVRPISSDAWLIGDLFRDPVIVRMSEGGYVATRVGVSPPGLDLGPSERPR